MGTSSLEAPVVKKRRSYIAASRGLASLSLLMGGSLARSITNPPNAIDWTSSDLYALMDHIEVAMGTLVPSEGGGS